jgi:hypothetical protein
MGRYLPWLFIWWRYIDFGSELDLVATYQINKNYGVLVKAANYSEGDAGIAPTDTNKLWLQMTAKF